MGGTLALMPQKPSDPADCHLTPHFKASEFACKCDTCQGKSLPKWLWGPYRHLAQYLEDVRKVVNDVSKGTFGGDDIPLTVISGYRCRHHPLFKLSSRHSPTDAHILAPRGDMWGRGVAADVCVLQKWDTRRVVWSGERLGGIADALLVPGVGVYPDRSRTCHLDTGWGGYVGTGKCFRRWVG